MGYVSVAVRSKTPSGVAGFLGNQWQLSRGIGGSFAMESVATFVWNEWQLCHGISGRFGVEYATNGLKEKNLGGHWHGGEERSERVRQLQPIKKGPYWKLR